MSEDNKKEITAFQRADNFMRATANTVTFGGADYLAGAADTALQKLMGEQANTVKENIDVQKRNSINAINETPLVYLGGQVAGGFLTIFGTGKIATLVMGEKLLANYQLLNKVEDVAKLGAFASIFSSTLIMSSDRDRFPLPTPNLKNEKDKGVVK